MPDFRFTPKLGNENPPPTQCTFCSTNQCDEGFVDLLIDHVPEGRIYACARCLWSAARLVGCIDPQQVAKRDATIAEQAAEVTRLVADLEYEKDHKVVSLEDVLALRR